MIRKGHYWLSILPKDIKEKFLKNYLPKSKSKTEIPIEEYLNWDFKFHNFIGDFDMSTINPINMSVPFTWETSPEGFLYWSEIANTNPMEFIKMKRNEKINDILDET